MVGGLTRALQEFGRRRSYITWHGSVDPSIERAKIGTPSSCLKTP